MNPLNILLDNQTSPAINQLAKNFGISDAAARAAISQMAPALTRGMQRGIGTPQGLETLSKALSGGSHQRYIDQPDSLAEEATQADGNAILGHLLGSKDASRALASQAAAQTGLDDSLLKKMLPVVAGMLMGSMSKQAAAGGQAGNSEPGGLLTQLLDSDGDGSVMDDILGMAGRFMR